MNKCGKLDPSGMIIWILLVASQVQATPVVQWDFRSGLQGWKGNHHVTSLELTREGLTFQSTGVDPWIEGPRVTVPAERITRVVVRMQSEADTRGELFYGPSFQAGRSVHFVVQNDGQWHDYELIITESLGSNTRFRLDPAAGPGPMTVQSITVESLQKIPAPPFAVPAQPETQRKPSLKISSGRLQVRHHGLRLGNFEVRIDQANVGVGYQSELLGLLTEEEPEWLNLGSTAADVQALDGNRLRVRASLQDRQGGTWSIEREFRIGEIEGSVTVTSRFTVDRQREAILLPWLTLYAGLGTYGDTKDQGLLAGLEYLRDEPSSSTADITTRDHLRRIPDPLKVTFPLMAVAQDNRCLGLIWEPSPWTNAVFDSPDRLTHSHAHLMGVTGPAVGPHRFENDLAAYRPVTLAAHQTVETTVTLTGDTGKTIVPAVQRYVELNPLLPLPEVEGGFPGAVTLLGHGWLDSQIREGGLFRHAVWQGKFNPTRAADAAAFMDWLATSLPADDPLIAALDAGRDQALGEIPAHHAFNSGVSHVRLPSASLRFGRVDRLVRDGHNSALNMLKAYTPEGALIYQQGDTDFASTHFADHANGYGARNLASILAHATLAMDPVLIEEALALLDKQTLLYGNTVPRGAQTWEIPLHTPDIMASAHMVRCYVLGHLLTGDSDYLDQARYWAWTGVPFLYLPDPTSGPVGRYATIPVLGATQWVGSWFGRPVQWCGLVYASALHLLSEVDPESPWRQLAQGITASGLQQCWTTEDTERQGLLPDFYYLEPQIPDGPAINPGTVQAHLPELFEHGALYDLKKLAQTNWILHAPCKLGDIQEAVNEVRFTVAGWGGLRRDRRYYVLISGMTERAHQVMRYQKEGGTWIWKNMPPEDITYNQEPGGYMTLYLQGPADIQIRVDR